ncbi:MAG: hypothetical protein ACLT4X_09250 [Phascolarctobacterium sp.]
MNIFPSIIYTKEKMDVWLFLDPAKEDIEKASDEIDQGEIGGMDMDGFPGTGGDEPTDGPQSPEDGEQVETAVQLTKDAGGLNHATRDSWDPMKHPRGPGAFLSRLMELVMKVIKNRT